MSSDILSSHLSTLERKLNLLLAEHKSLKEEYNSLLDENESLRTTIKLNDNQISDFQNRIKISKIAGHVAVENREATELKNKIDEYIKEIDRCIVHLSE